MTNYFPLLLETDDRVVPIYCFFLVVGFQNWGRHIFCSVHWSPQLGYLDVIRMTSTGSKPGADVTNKF